MNMIAKEKAHSCLVARTRINVECVSHINADAELFVPISEGACAVVNGVEYQLSAGECLYISPFETHRFFSKKPNKCLVLMFSMEAFSDASIYFNKYMLENRVVRLPEYSKKRIGQMLCSEDGDAFAEGYISMRALLYPVFELLTGQNKTLKKTNAENGFLQKALQIISEEFSENISLGSVAKRVGVHYVHLGRVIKEKCGGGFVFLLSSVRVNHAMILLGETKMTVSCVAHECGFGSLRNFNRVFLSYTGMTPNEYRRKA